MHLKNVLAVAAICLSASACTAGNGEREREGSADAGEKASVVGSAFGRTLVAADAVATIGTEERLANLTITISDFGGLCDAFEADEAKAGAVALFLPITRLKNGDVTSIGVGTYDQHGEQTEKGDLNAWFTIWDSACGETLSTNDAVPASGSVTLSEITSNEVKGSFALTFKDGGSLSGQFTAPICSTSAFEKAPQGCRE